MGKTTTIWIKDEDLHENAKILADLMDKSFGELVWDLLEREVHNNNDTIEKVKDAKTRIFVS